MFEVDYKPAVVPLFHVRVCINRRLNTDNLPNCAGRGSRELADRLEQRIAAENLPVKVLRGPCMNNCAIGPNIKIQAGAMLNLNTDVSDERFERVMHEIRDEVKKRAANPISEPEASDTEPAAP
ncbi:MAG: (2Fe-2S) ferredoxin domain-containing protein [Rhodospirillaceae bacterium]|nr:(2Fe-2S) ferredoxin domain-containing protein [Rhodospirillaceae bacterium]